MKVSILINNDPWFQESGDFPLQHNCPEGPFPIRTLAFRRDFLERHLPWDFSDQLPYSIDIRLTILAHCTRFIQFLKEPQTRSRTRLTSLHAPVRSQTQTAVTRLNFEGINPIANQVEKPSINCWFDYRDYPQRLRELLPKHLGYFLARFRKQ